MQYVMELIFSVARFIVQVRPSGTYVLQNYKEPSNHLAIYQGQLIGTVCRMGVVVYVDVCSCLCSRVCG